VNIRAQAVVKPPVGRQGPVAASFPCRQRGAQAWTDLARRGVPPFSQLHNCSNHPGIFGMTVYADTILRFFEPPGP